MNINNITLKEDLVPATDLVHQLSAEEFNSIVEYLKNVQEYLSNVEKTELSIQHDVPNNTFMVNTDDVEAFLKFTPYYRTTRTNVETGDVVTNNIYSVCQITISSQKDSISYVSTTCTPQSIDIKGLLSTGSNVVTVTVSADGETKSTGFNVILTALSLGENNLQWYKPFYSTDNTYQIGGFRITGVIDKTVHIDISGSGYHKHYTDEIGTNTYPTNAYAYTLTNEDFPTTGTGSYKVDVYITSNNIETQHIVYDMLCVEDSDRSSATLIAVKQPTSKILNLTSQKIAEYVVYDGTSETSNVQIKVATLQDGLEETTLINTTIQAETNTNNEFVAQLNYNGTELTKDAVCIVSVKNKQKSFNFVIDNSTSIPPVPGASFYIDPANRYNSASDKESIINAANNAEITASWSSVSFVDGVDGWTVDKDNVKALVLPAASSCDVEYKPLQSAGTSASKVFDFAYKVENVSDYDEPVITICDDASSDNFVGIKIFPTKIIVHSNLKKSAEIYDLIQGTNITDEELTNVQICMCPNYNINYGNFLIVYVNGIKKCEFAYDDIGDSFQNSGDIVFGGDYADLYLYSFRIYDSAFNYKNALNNFYSSLHTTVEKQAAFAEDEAVLGDGNEINLDKVRDTNKYNYFIVEPLEDAALPAYGAPEGYTCDCNFEMHYPNETGWDYYIKNATLQGQGTTSMQYYVWNLRIRSDKNDNTEVSYNGTDFESSKTVNIDGDNHPAVKRITAKKNYASSMQSHKMGSTSAFNDLHDAVCGQNEAGTRTAVYQYPAYGFIKQYDERGHEVYKFIGLYTIGPDKGDKATFGYDGRYQNTLLSLEGLDHNRPLTLFKYPWTSDVKCYDGENIGIENGINSYDNGWEVSAGNSDFVETLWKPAYEQVYSNSPFIIGVSQSISSINSDVDSFRSQQLANGRKYEDYDIWTSSDYTLYYYDLKLKQYVSTGVNVYTDVASYIDASEWTAADTLQKKNDAIIKARVKRFKETMSAYWDVDDTLFHYCFVMMFAASDNFAKNTYPYNFGASTSKWRWRQDDLDTLFDSDNYGRATKGTSVEYEDLTEDETQHVFKGEQSALWTLIHLAYEKYDTSGKLSVMCYNILKAMCELGASNASNVSYGYDSIMRFFQKYYFDKAEEYFTRSSYNVDAENSYEMAYADKNYLQSAPIDPLSQSLGNHIEATKFWLSRRIIYLMSKYTFGEFSSDSATGLGIIEVRPQESINLTLVPAVDMYPTIISGQSARYKSSDRVFAGNSAYIDGQYGGNNTVIYVAAADYIREIQGLEDLQTESNTELNVSSKRLQRLNIGDTLTKNHTTNINTLNIGRCPSLEYVNAKNVSSLTNVIDLSGCPRIKEAYFGGTNIQGISIANGAKIHTLTLPASIATLSLRNLPDLQTFSIADTDNLSYIRVENTPNIFDGDDIFDFLLTDQNGVSDRQIQTAIKIDNLDISIDNIKMLILYNYCDNADNALNYIHGIDSNGNRDVTMYPVLSGTMTQEDEGANTTIYTSSQVKTINRVFPYINLVLQDVQIEFEDSRLPTYVFTDGTYTANQFATWTEQQLYYVFSNAQSAQIPHLTFNEFEYFTNIEDYDVDSSSFHSSSISEITLPKNLKAFNANGSYGLEIQKINLGKNKNFELVGNCLMGLPLADDSDPKTKIHCVQGTSVKIPSNTTSISYSALASIQQDVLVIPNGVRFTTVMYKIGQTNDAIIFEDSNSTNMTFGISTNSCDIYIMNGAPVNHSGSEGYWISYDLNHHIYVPVGTRQQYIEYSDGHYDPELFVEFDPETDETFLSLMEEYNNMEV